MANCVICAKNVSSRDKISCNVCCGTFHLACVNLKTQDAKFLFESGEPFSCPSCSSSARQLRSRNVGGTPVSPSVSGNPSSPDTRIDQILRAMGKLAVLDQIAEDIASIKSTQNKLTEQLAKCTDTLRAHEMILNEHSNALKTCQKDVKSLQDTHNVLETNLLTIGDRMDQIENIARTVEQSSSPSVGGQGVAQDEIIQRIKRSHNIIVRNVPESSSVVSDNAVAREVIGKIDEGAVNSITAVVRLGAESSHRPRPIRIEFNNPNTAIRILRNKKALMGFPDFSKVALSDDKTLMQSQQLHKLRKELDQRRLSGQNNPTIKYVKGSPMIDTMNTESRSEN